MQIDSARHTAAQVIGKIASVDLVDKQWNELIPALQTNMAQPSAGLKQCTLQALGYVCEEMRSADLDQAQVNTMLTAIVQGMRKEEPDNEIRLAATNALFNALLFANENFKNVFERNFIMQVVCEGTLCPDVRVRWRLRLRPPALSAGKTPVQLRRSVGMSAVSSERRTGARLGRCHRFPVQMRKQSGDFKGGSRALASGDFCFMYYVHHTFPERAQSPTAPRQVRQAAMECLVGIAQEYYMYLEPYIKDIFALTCKAVCSHFAAPHQAIL